MPIQPLFRVVRWRTRLSVSVDPPWFCASSLFLLRASFAAPTHVIRFSVYLYIVDMTTGSKKCCYLEHLVPRVEPQLSVRSALLIYTQPSTLVI